LNEVNWSTDIAFYSNALVKPWKVYEKDIPSRFGWEIAILSTLSIFSIPFPPFLIGRRVLLWAIYNLVVYAVYGVILTIIRDKTQVKSLYKTLPFSYLPLVAGSFSFPLFVFLFIPLAEGAIWAFHLPTSSFFSPCPPFIAYYWVLVSLWMVFYQIFLLKKQLGKSILVATLWVIIAQIFGFIAAFYFNRLCLWAFWIF